MKIPLSISQIITSVESAGFQIFAVGGCVRDNIMGKTPSDWDLTTSALPNQIIALFPDKKVLTTGLKHGTVTVLAEGNPVEITTFRIDGAYADGRHPLDVTFSDNIVDDLKRRDFTINAMAYNHKSGICDPFDGQRDINSKTIRAVGDPVQRFSEDALRIMRAIRFSAQLDFDIEKQTKSALFSCKQLLNKIAAERITAEFTKTLTATNPSRALTQYFTVTSEIFFGALKTDVQKIDFSIIDKLPPLVIPRLAVYLQLASHIFRVSANELAKIFFRQMRFSSQTTKHVTTVMGLTDTPLPTDPINLKKLLIHNSFEDLCFAASAQQQLSRHYDKYEAILCTLHSIRQNNECLKIADLDINGTDLSTQLNLSGKEIGNALNRLLIAVIEGKCPNKKDALTDFLKSAP